MLWLEDVHVRRGGTHALRGIDLEVRRGEIVALIGANGAGKTTTLAAISGLLRCQQGRIDFAHAGERLDISRMRAERIVAAGISHCPEGRQIFGNLSVSENLMAGSSAMEVSVLSVMSAPASGCLLARSIATTPPREWP